MTAAANPARRAPWLWLLLGAGPGTLLLAATALLPEGRGRAVASGVTALLLLMGSAAYGARKWLLVARLGSLHAWMVGHVALGTALMFAVVAHASLTDLGGPGLALVGLVAVQVASGVWAMVELFRTPRRFGKLPPGDAGFPTTVRRRLAVLGEGVEDLLRRRSASLRDWFEGRYRAVIDGRAAEVPPLEGFASADARAAADLHERVREIERLRTALVHLEQAERSSTRWSWVHVPATVALVTMVVLHVIGWLVYG